MPQHLSPPPMSVPSVPFSSHQRRHCCQDAPVPVSKSHPDSSSLLLEGLVDAFTPALVSPTSSQVSWFQTSSFGNLQWSSAERGFFCSAAFCSRARSMCPECS
ncbi:hypothetical protein ILYODFUR_000337 [Ilyodon furcidens]|uniref:Uncharacterized protein n=1 Tax=Ilyodon furcidens TaxID=33524 RepID=A0ABV0SHP4_9TELE